MTIQKLKTTIKAILVIMFVLGVTGLCLEHTQNSKMAIYPYGLIFLLMVPNTKAMIIHNHMTRKSNNGIHDQIG